MKNADYFTIKRVIYHPSLQFMASSDVEDLKGKNLFAVDLKKVQRQLQRRYPKISQLRVTRQFPNQIHIVAKTRLPFARVKINNFIFVVDEESTVLSPGEAASFILPLIEGVHLKEARVTIGSKLRKKNLRIAFQIINTFNKNKDLSMQKIEKIDVNNLSKIGMYLSNNLRVVVDRDDIKHKLEMLALVLLQGQTDLGTVKYIDLRFKEPIIKKDSSRR